MPPYTIEHYARRTFALYDEGQPKDQQLIAVTLYKKGARRIAEELIRRDMEIDKHSKITPSN